MSVGSNNVQRCVSIFPGLVDEIWIPLHQLLNSTSGPTNTIHMRKYTYVKGVHLYVHSPDCMLIHGQQVHVYCNGLQVRGMAIVSLSTEKKREC